MAVVENAGVELGRSVGSAPPSQEAASGGAPNDQDQAKHGQIRHRIDQGLHQNNNAPILRAHDQGLYMKVAPPVQMVQLGGFDHGGKIGAQVMQAGPVHHQRSNGGDLPRNGDHVGDSFNRDMRELRDLFSKLNPMAEEFVPPSLSSNHGVNGGFNNFAILHNAADGGRQGNINGLAARRVLMFLDFDFVECIFL